MISAFFRTEIRESVLKRLIKEAEREFYKNERGVVVINCSKCDDVMKSIKAWATHQLKVHKVNVGWAHGPDNRKKLPCPDCGDLYTWPELRGHLEAVHKKSVLLRCSEVGCGGKSFPTKTQFSRHIRNCHSSRPCPICGVAFASKGKLGRGTYLSKI
jgi:hypothetical protein